MRTTWLSGLVVVTTLFAQTGQPRLIIEVIEGEGAINNTRQRTSRETIVEVQDENHRPVAGASVAFLLPGEGPGGAFAGRVKSVVITANDLGRARMPKLQPNQLTGKFQIRVNASVGGRQGATTISQSNTAASAAASSSTAAVHAGISGKAIGIIVAIAAAGAAGAAVGLSGGKGNTSIAATPLPPSASIAAGSGVALGPPH
jgi:hypothetical protein